MRYAAAENTRRKAGIINKNLSVRQDMQLGFGIVIPSEVEESRGAT
jgi:hypothetical protein